MQTERVQVRQAFRAGWQVLLRMRALWGAMGLVCLILVGGIFSPFYVSDWVILAFAVLLGPAVASAELLMDRIHGGAGGDSKLPTARAWHPVRWLLSTLAVLWVLGGTILAGLAWSFFFVRICYAIGLAQEGFFVHPEGGFAAGGLVTLWLFIVLAYFFTIGWAFAPLYIVRDGAGLIAAMRRGLAVTRGSKARLALIGAPSLIVFSVYAYLIFGQLFVGDGGSGGVPALALVLLGVLTLVLLPWTMSSLVAAHARIEASFDEAEDQRAEEAT